MVCVVVAMLLGGTAGASYWIGKERGLLEGESEGRRRTVEQLVAGKGVNTEIPNGILRRYSGHFSIVTDIETGDVLDYGFRGGIDSPGSESDPRPLASVTSIRPY